MSSLTRTAKRHNKKKEIQQQMDMAEQFMLLAAEYHPKIIEIFTDALNYDTTGKYTDKKWSIDDIAAELDVILSENPEFVAENSPVTSRRTISGEVEEI